MSLNLHQKLSLPDLQNWIENVIKLTQPNKIYLCDGTETEYKNLINEMQETEDLIKLNSENIS